MKKSCSDTREKCVLMEKARVIAMDSENPMKLTTEGMNNYFKLINIIFQYREVLYIAWVFIVTLDFKIFRQPWAISFVISSMSTVAT